MNKEILKNYKHLGRKKLKLSQIKLDQGIYPRFETDEERAKFFAQLLKEGNEFEPIVVAPTETEGLYELLDGNHRLLAHQIAGYEEIEADVYEVPKKERRLISAGLNNKTSKPLSEGELKDAVVKAYTVDGIKDLKRIADLVGCSLRTVERYTKEIREREREELKKKAWELKEQGLSVREIAKKLGVSKSTIADWLSEKRQLSQIAQISLFTTNGDPTPEGLRLWSEYVEQSDTEKEDLFNPERFSEFLKKKGLEAQKVEKIGKVYFNGTPEQAFMMVVEQAIKQRIQNAVNNGLDERDIKLLISKGKTGIFQYMSSTAKAKLAGLLSDYIQEQIQKREERQKEEELIIETAKEILQNPEFIFSSWTNLGKEVLKRLEEKGNYLRHKYHEGHVSEILKKYSDALLGVYKSIPEITQEELESLIQDYDLEEFESLEQFRETLKAQIIQQGKRPAGVDVLATKVWNEYYSQKIKQQEKAPPSPPPSPEELEDSTEESSPSNETEENWDEILKPFAEAYDRVFGKDQENQEQQEEQKPKLKRGRPPKEGKDFKEMTSTEQYLWAITQIEYWTLWILDRWGREEAKKVLKTLLKDLESLSNEQLADAWKEAFALALADRRIRDWEYWN